jgi:hypothetical protein
LIVISRCAVFLSACTLSPSFMTSSLTTMVSSYSEWVCCLLCPFLPLPFLFSGTVLPPLSRPASTLPGLHLIFVHFALPLPLPLSLSLSPYPPLSLAPPCEDIDMTRHLRTCRQAGLAPPRRTARCWYLRTNTSMFWTADHVCSAGLEF